MSNKIAESVYFYAGMMESQITVLDLIKGTPFYSQKEKNLCKNLGNLMITKLNSLYNGIEELEKYQFMMVEMHEIFRQKTIEDPEKMYKFMLDVKDDNIRYE